MNTQTLTLGLLLATLALSGCGFHLRGTGPGAGTLNTPVAIAGLPPYGPLQRELRRALDAAGAQLDETTPQPAVLRVANHDSSRRVLSVDSRNKASEYELLEALEFRLTSASGEELVASQTVRTVRVLFNPETEVLGRNREEDLLREDMRRELAERVVQRLAAQR